MASTKIAAEPTRERGRDGRVRKELATGVSRVGGRASRRAPYLTLVNR
jgi:hypothetical protein